MFNPQGQQPMFNRGQSAVSPAQSQASTLFLAKVFNWMAVGLAITGVTAYVTASTALFQVVQPIIFLLFIVEIGLVFFLSARINRLSAGAATGIFLAYSFLNGLTLSTILLIYTRTSIASTFLITAGMFGAMAVYGLVTKRDLTAMGSFLFMGLVGIIIASIVNIFLGSPMMAWMISGIGVIIFTGLTAYDVQKLTQMGGAGIMNEDGTTVQRMAVMGALTLYLDFINLFLMLLQFFGNSRD